MRRLTLVASIVTGLLAAGLLAIAPGAGAAGTATRKLGWGTNNKSLEVPKGTVLTVTLHSTYWTFDALEGTALRAVGKPVVKAAPPGSCVPGGGCGTVTQKYRAVTTGPATINAGRSVCGEALACGPTNGTYVVYITVTAPGGRASGH